MSAIPSRQIPMDRPATVMPAFIITARPIAWDIQLQSGLSVTCLLYTSGPDGVFGTEDDEVYWNGPDGIPVTEDDELVHPGLDGKLETGDDWVENGHNYPETCLLYTSRCV